MNPIGAGLLLVLLGVVWVAPRRWALLAMMAGVVYLTQGQAVQIAGFNMFPHRFLELAGFLRVMSRREYSFQRLNQIDLALLWFYGYTTLVFLIRSKEGQAYQIGTTLDALLSYFTFRGLFKDIEAIWLFLRDLVVLVVPFVILVLSERFTHHNPFVAMGGIEGGAHWMRNGVPRCFGTFRQPDTLGMFGATFLPLYLGTLGMPAMRSRAFIGFLLCLLLVWAANSGGAASAAVVGIGCWVLWRIRTRMRLVRWGIVGAIGLLALMMKAPIWYIFARASLITGGDGWHRSYLIDVSYRHLSEWWLAGMPIKMTSGWFAYDLEATGGADISNQYIGIGLTAGLGGIVLFVILIKRAFGMLGVAMAELRMRSHYVHENEFLLWGLGSMLTVHIVNWFGISYFDQMYMVWCLQLAVLGNFSQSVIDMLSETPLPATEALNPPELRHGDCFTS